MPDEVSRVREAGDILEVSVQEGLPRSIFSEVVGGIALPIVGFVGIGIGTQSIAYELLQGFGGEYSHAISILPTIAVESALYLTLYDTVMGSITNLGKRMFNTSILYPEP